MHTQHVHALNTYAIHLPECAKERENERTLSKIACSFVLGVRGGENIDNIYSVVSIENMYCISYYYSNW